MQDLIVSQPGLVEVRQSKILVPEHEAAEHVVLLILAEDAAGDGGIHIANSRCVSTGGQTNVQLGICARCAGQKLLPLSIVEACIHAAIVAQNAALLVVVELDPEAVELHVLKEIHHLVAVVEGALRGTCDDIVAARHFNQTSQSLNHALVSKVTSC